MRPLRQTDPHLRQAIVKLNQRQHGEVEDIPFLKGGRETEALLRQLVADDEVADLPRVNGLTTLFSMQFRAPDAATLESRDRAECVRLMLELLCSGRLPVRAAAAFQMVRFMQLSELYRMGVPRDEEVKAALAEVLEERGLPSETSKHVEWWLAGGGRPTRA